MANKFPINELGVAMMNAKLASHISERKNPSCFANAFSCLRSSIFIISISLIDFIRQNY